MALPHSTLSSRPVSNDGSDVARTLRRVGYSVLVAAIILDIASGPIASVGDIVRAQWSKAMDLTLPRENILLDVALSVLGASDH